MDFKKDFKEQYQPKTTPSVVEIPEMVIIAVDGVGDPNTSEAYKTAIETLYGLSYAIKMGNKAVLEYVVGPLEGFWDASGAFEGGGAPVLDKSKFAWTSFIRQPDFVNREVFEKAAAAVAKKKPELDLSKARLETIAEGLCVQVMHIGPFDTEYATVALLDQYAADNGYIMDFSDKRRHHEIYLSDPRKVAPEKMKTIIRHPVRRA